MHTKLDMQVKTLAPHLHALASRHGMLSQLRQVADTEECFEARSERSHWVEECLLTLMRLGRLSADELPRLEEETERLLALGEEASP